MLFRLGVTGCGSRVALGEMLKGFADSLITALRRQHCRSAHKVFGRAGSARNPGMPLRLQSCCDPFASVPAVFGPEGGGEVHWRSEPLDRESASLHLSPPNFMSSLAPPGGVRGAGAVRLLPLPRHRAWPGGGCGGARGDTANLLCISRGASPLTLGPAPRRRRRGARLDWAFAFYASRRQPRAWPGGTHRHRDSSSSLRRVRRT